ncbi:hypothetical protein [Alteribacter aurantiacus]|uniref:hypothetical protein n=1 Tax=Alteribacter aurantiacus TaxID=254410 RepID=UPI00068756EE|nr:hypothetical protein [Alteribacter aurantiacus]
MKLVSILSGKGFVMYNKELAHEVSVNGSIIFGQLCSSYESFDSKGMLTNKDGKKYFFLTAETLEEETALTYKQQLKATKELETAGYIQTRTMGMPSKKYFHITKKIEKVLIGIPSSDKREDLDTNSNPTNEGQKVNARYDEKEYHALTKSNGMHEQKVTLKINNKNKKYKNKNIKLNLNPNPIDIYEILWEAQFPKELKNRIKVMISNKSVSLSSEQILLIEDAYKYQIGREYVIPNCALDDTTALNDHEFSKTVIKMLEVCKNINNMRGMIKEWVEKAYCFKLDQHRVSDYSCGNTPSWLTE